MLQIYNTKFANGIYLTKNIYLLPIDLGNEPNASKQINQSIYKRFKPWRRPARFPHKFYQ